MEFVKQIEEIQRSMEGKSKKELAEQMAKIRLPRSLSIISKCLILIEVAVIWFFPSALTSLYLSQAPSESLLVRSAFYGCSPFIFILLFVLTAGVFAQLGKIGIIEGKFPRLDNHPIYALRKIYGSAWTQIYYFKPLYAVCLALPPLKYLLLRVFGFKGQLDITIYPDSWIRDLPLIKADKGVYLANRCVIGTNLCLNDGSILVGPCAFGESSMVGHLAVFGLGCHMGEKSELGVGAALGIRVMIGARVQIAPRAEINHAVDLQDDVKIGTSAVVGMKARISRGIEIRPGASIPPGADIKTQEEADSYFSSENQKMKDNMSTLISLLEEQIKHGPSVRTNQGS